MRSCTIKICIALFVFVICSMAQTEILRNGDFTDAADTSWKTVASQGNGGAATGVIVNGEYVITITKGGGQEYSIQVVQLNFKIEKAKSYHLKFDISASSDRNITFGVGMNGTPYYTYSSIDNQGEMPVAVTTAMQTKDTSFTMIHETDTIARIFFNLGKNTGTVTIDNVSLQEIGAPVKPRMASYSAAKSGLTLSRGGILLEKITASSRLNVFSPQGKLVKDLTSRLGHADVISWGSTGLESGSYIIRLYDKNGQVVRSATITK
jgi:hypothetical protein